MKPVACALVVVVALIGTSGCKRNKTEISSLSFKPTFAPAARGTNTGTATSRMISSNGGKVSSADGRIDLTIPAGAFTTTTEVSVQPITNTAPNGMGVAYRLLPEATTFSQPVTVTFHLDQNQTAGIDSTFIASQHADGLWYSQPHQARDESGKTISVGAKHFSDWVVAQSVVLTPQQARVRTSQGANFVPTIVAAKDDDDALANPAVNELAISEPQPLKNQIGGKRSWQVNAVDGGKTTIGFVTDRDGTGEYKAPRVPPVPNNVAVTLTLQFGKGKVIAPANVEIYDQETWSGTSHIQMTNGTIVDAEFTLSQNADQGGTYQFNVKHGQVHVHVPDTLPSGCTQKVSPTDQDIGSNDGYMTATYDMKNGPDSPMVSGHGATVWLATYTVTCPNGTNSMPSGIQAEWWPMMLGAMPTPVEATDGVYDNVVSGQMGSGNVHLIRQ
jgi:hypothetical protein